MKYQKSFTVYPQVEWNYPLILKKEEAGLMGVTRIGCEDIEGNKLDYLDKSDYLFINAPDLEADKPYKIVITYERGEIK